MRRRTQLYLDEDQYRWLKRQAGARGSIAGVIRRLIDSARDAARVDRDDPFMEYLRTPPAQGEGTTSVVTLDEDLYGR